MGRCGLTWHLFQWEKTPCGEPKRALPAAASVAG